MDLYHIPSTLPQPVQELLHGYFNLHIGAHTVPCPYWVDKLHRKHSLPPLTGPLGGKGTPWEIEQAVRDIAGQHRVNLETLTQEQARLFMKKHHLGVDCSGFAYQLLEAFDRYLGGTGLDRQITPTTTQSDSPPRFRTNADYLTNHHNSVAITSLSQITPGDLIRIHGGKHIAVILELQPDQLIYAHSSSLTKIKGAHVAGIAITQSNQGLEMQTWLELTAKGRDFGQHYFKPSDGDGIFRLKWLI